MKVVFPISRLTYLLLILVVSTLALSVVRRMSPASGAGQTPKPNRIQEAKQHFPTAEYEEPDLPDPARNAAKKEKQKRHNNFKLVAKNPQPGQTESLFVPEGIFDFPALPVSTSQLIIVGRVSEASAHLSEDKTNVYSEFLVAVSSVLKTPAKEISENSVLTIERLGGNVRYPNGQTILFRISGWNMPKIGSEYLFFLFEALRGTSSIEILEQVRALIYLPDHE